MESLEIPVTDLSAIHAAIHEEMMDAIEGVLSSSRFILGETVERFEREMAGYVGVRYAIGVASGTDALHIALLACGVGPGDKVITTPFSFIASSESIVRCGAVPVFADVEARTYNLDPAGIEERITPETAAILPVHLFGQPAHMGPIMEMAHRRGLKVIEDCAQAFGAQIDGRQAGSIGDAGCFSFFPSKILGALGDGGMVVTDDADVARKCRIIRDHGATRKYIHETHGFNSRLDALQAAVLSVKLRHVEDWIASRISAAAQYRKALEPLPVVPPAASSGARHVFNYYTIRAAGRRDELQRHLGENGISSAVYYPLSLHLQEVYRDMGYGPGSFPESERAQQEVLSLPMYAGMTEKQVLAVAEAVGTFYSNVSRAGC